MGRSQSSLPKLPLPPQQHPTRNPLAEEGLPSISTNLRLQQLTDHFLLKPRLMIMSSLKSPIMGAKELDPTATSLQRVTKSQSSILLERMVLSFLTLTRFCLSQLCNACVEKKSLKSCKNINCCHNSVRPDTFQTTYKSI